MAAHLNNYSRMVRMIRNKNSLAFWHLVADFFPTYCWSASVILHEVCVLFSYDQSDSNFHGLSLANSQATWVLVKIHKLVLKKSEATKGDVNPKPLYTLN